METIYLTSILTWHVINALNKGNLRLNDLSVSIKNVSFDNELVLKMIKLEFSFVNGIINSK